MASVSYPAARQLLLSSCFAREENGAQAFAQNPETPRLVRMGGIETGEYATAIKAYSSGKGVTSIHVSTFWLRAATRSFQLLDSGDFGQSVQLTGLGSWYRQPPTLRQDIPSASPRQVLDSTFTLAVAMVILQWRRC